MNEFQDVSAAMAMRDANSTGTAAIEALRVAARAGRVEVEKDPDGPRQFMSPVEPNSTWLVSTGTANYAPYQQTVLGMQPLLSRNDDVWAEFNSGVCWTLDPVVIAFLEGHSGDKDRHAEYHKAMGSEARTCTVPVGLCRESGPGVDDWFKMKLAQVPLKSRNAGLDQGIDVDAYFDGQNARSLDHRPSEGVERIAEANANAHRERSRGSV